MKTIMVGLLGLIALSSFSHATGNPVFLGTFPLAISEIGQPDLNDVNFGDLTRDSVYADYTFSESQDQTVFIGMGNTAAMGCHVSDIQAQYVWIEKKADGTDGVATPVLFGASFGLKANTNYVLRATYSHFSNCTYLQYSFSVVNLPQSNLK